MLKKIFRRDVFTLISLFAFIWFLILEIGTPYAKKYSSTINSLLNEQETITIGGGNTYYQSKYLTVNSNGDYTTNNFLIITNDWVIASYSSEKNYNISFYGYYDYFSLD